MKLLAILAPLFAIFAQTCYGAPWLSGTFSDYNQNHISEYQIPVRSRNGAGKLWEKVRIDTKSEIEVFTVPGNGRRDGGNIIKDFKQKLTMIKVPRTGSCYLAIEVSGMPPKMFKAYMEKPESEESEQVLRRAKANASTVTPTSYWSVDVPLLDRSILGEEMAIMCARYPIYMIKRSGGVRTQTRATGVQALARKRRAASCDVVVCTDQKTCKIYYDYSDGQWKKACSYCWYIYC